MLFAAITAVAGSSVGVAQAATLDEIKKRGYLLVATEGVPETVGEVIAVMRTPSAEGRTMLVVTHEMQFARETADEIVFIDRGRIVEKSAPQLFFASPQTERARQFLQRYSVR
jgi:ABC-type histidine transport system ATPase subunit